MKRTLTILVAVCCLYFAGGYLAVQLGRLGESTYLTFATIAGGLASVIGLLSLARPSIAKSDIEALELDALGRISTLSNELQEAKLKTARTQEDIARLQAQRAEMELLVRKASLVLFLRERMKQHEKRIAEIIGESKELSTLLPEYDEARKRVKALDEEVSADPNVDILRDVMHAARPRADLGGGVALSIARALAEKWMGTVLR